MLVQLPVPWLVAVDILAWLLIHLGVAWLGTELPDRLFKPNAWLFRPRAWERGGGVYQRLFRVRSWKASLPDGAALFRKGFPKARLAGRDPAYLQRFIRETCRGEAVHWAVLAASLLFFLWNPWWVGLIMVAYAALANLPCIITQRYNRFRIREKRT